MDNTNKLRLLALSLTTLSYSDFHNSYMARRDKPIKKCKRCGKEHQHNNSWCSAECSKLDRKGK